MNYCEWLSDDCDSMELDDPNYDDWNYDEPALCKIGGHWFCAGHEDAAKRAWIKHTVSLNNPS